MTLTHPMPLSPSQASLAALSQQVEAEAQPLPMTRFRPNIVIGGVEEPWAEDSWHTLSVGGQSGSQAVQVRGCCSEITLKQPWGGHRLSWLRTPGTS